MTVDYYTSQIDYYTQVLANLEAQKAKVEQFELENPPPTVEQSEDLPLGPEPDEP